MDVFHRILLFCDDSRVVGVKGRNYRTQFQHGSGAYETKTRPSSRFVDIPGIIYTV